MQCCHRDTKHIEIKNAALHVLYVPVVKEGVMKIVYNRTWTLWILVVLVWLNPVVLAETSVSLGVRYDTFADRDYAEVTGTEWTFPFGALYSWNRLLLRLESAYSMADADYSLTPEPEITSLTDTLLAASYVVFELPISVILGVDLNLQTGQESLSRYEQIAEAGERHDLFEVDNFGEGFNVGANVGVSKEFKSFTLGVSGAYLWKGKYDPTSEISRDDLDPGDQIVLVALTKWKVGGGLAIDTTTAYAQSSADTTDGKEAFREGRKLLISGVVRLQRPAFGVTVGAQNTFQGKNKELAEDHLETEPENSNGNELFGWCDFTYRFSPSIDLQLLGDLRFYGESDRKNELNGLPFEGKRVRFGFGPGIMFLQNDHLTWNAVVKYFRMRQEPDIRDEEEQVLRGVNVSFGMTYLF